MDDVERYALYQRARETLETGWIQRKYYRTVRWFDVETGRMQTSVEACLAGSITRSAGSLPPDVRLELHQRLRMYPSFWVGCGLSLVRCGSLDGAIPFFNDRRWRRQETVVAVVAKLEKKWEGPAAIQRSIELTAEVAVLRDKISQLTEELERLRAANRSLMDRVFTDSKAERKRVLRALSQLDRELEAHMAEQASLEGRPLHG